MADHSATGAPFPGLPTADPAGPAGAIVNVGTDPLVDFDVPTNYTVLEVGGARALIDLTVLVPDGASPDVPTDAAFVAGVEFYLYGELSGVEAGTAEWEVRILDGATVVATMTGVTNDLADGYWEAYGTFSDEADLAGIVAAHTTDTARIGLAFPTAASAAELWWDLGEWYAYYDEQPPDVDPDPDDAETEDAVLVAEVEDESDVPDDTPVIDPDLSGIGIIRRVSETYPAPTLDPDTGRPVDWLPSSVVDEEWGLVTIAIGGVAVTTVRGIRTEILSLTFQEPFGEGPGQILVRGASLWDKGTAGFEWLDEEKNVDISRTTAAGVHVRTLWCGYVHALRPSRDGWELGVEGAFAGPMGMFPHRPKLFDAERDWGTSMTMAIRRARYGHGRVKGMTSVAFGITTRDRGARSETALEYVNRGLGMCQEDNGDQWTLARQLSGGNPVRRRYEWRLKDRVTEDVTLRAGQRGVDLSGLSRDASDIVRLVLGEGVNAAGGRWRGTKLSNVGKETIPPWHGVNLELGSTGDDVKIWQYEVSSDGHSVGTSNAIGSGVFAALEEEAAKDIQRAAGLPVTGIVNEATWDATWSNGEYTLGLGGAFFAPIAADPRVVNWLRSSNGSVLAVNPDNVPGVFPFGRFESYGSGVSKKLATRTAKAELARSADAWWRGTITLDGVDPPEMSRLDIMEGMNVRLLDFDDEPLLHIAGIRWSRNGPSWSVDLDVDEKARDLLTLAQMKVRDREARQDPVRQAINQLRRSPHARDTPGVWDTEGGFGQLPRRDATGSAWNVYRIAAGQYGSLSRVLLHTSPNARFTVALFGAKVTASWLNSVMPAPHADPGDTGFLPWDKPGIQTALRQRLFIEAWGGFGQRCGYSPGYETHPVSGKATTNPVTGDLDALSSTDYALESEPSLFVCVWPTVSCSIWGQIRLLPNE